MSIIDKSIDTEYSLMVIQDESIWREMGNDFIEYGFFFRGDANVMKAIEVMFV